ncbi:MAG: class I SAM-dependent methyltransferase [Alphaproteobacteria bacterium]|nr:class I SAM-dependent methyltransferase [Alphaproteobacteria bacterium]
MSGPATGGPAAIAARFPIESQTSDSDKLFLLDMQRLIRDVAPIYDYLEIGSFLGGSLAPFLGDPACRSILSIDDRALTLPDERGALYDYAGVTTQSMLDRLHLAGLATDKIATHDGSVDTLPAPDRLYDLAFIDGEHTDQACFRDFLWTLPLMKPDAAIMFHDSSLIYKAIRLIQLYLRKSGRPFRLLKKKDSEMSAVFLGAMVGRDLDSYFAAGEDVAHFYVASEAHVLESNIRNRVRVGPGEDRLLEFTIEPPKAVKAYF